MTTGRMEPAGGSRPGLANGPAEDRFFIQPHFVLLSYFALGAVAWGVSMPQQLACAIWLGAFALATALHPANGVTALILCVPLFLSPSHRPYIWMVDAMAWWLVIVTAVQAVIRRPAAPPLAAVAGLLALVAALAAPLDAREFPYQYWAAGRWDYFHWGLAAHPLTSAHYFRMVLDIASGAAVFYAAAAYFPLREGAAVRSLLYSIAVMAAFNIEVGRLATRRLLMDGLGDEWTYLGLAHSDLVSITRVGNQAFAHNPQIFTAYVLLCSPMAVHFLLSGGKKPLAVAAGAVFLGNTMLGLAQSGQRSPFVFFTAISVIWAYLYVRAFPVSSAARRLIIGASAAVAALFGAAWLIKGRGVGHGLGMLGWDYIAQDGRVYLWGTALQMLKSSPLLGVGTGRYSYRFREFYNGPEDIPGSLNVTDIFGEAHSLYFQNLAEQGLFGLGIWILFLAGLFLLAWRTLGDRSLPEWMRGAALTISVSLLFWAALGNVNNPFSIRVIGLYVFMAGGLLAGLASSAGHSFPIPSPRLVRVFSVALAAAFALQAAMAMARPVPAHFEFGFHPWESAEGKAARWTSQRAVMKIDDYTGDRLKIKVSAPLPWTGRQQKAWLKFGEESREVLFSGAGWAEVEFGPGNRGGRDGVLKIRTEFTVNPAKDLGGADNRDLGVYMMSIPRITQPDGRP